MHDLLFHPIGLAECQALPNVLFQFGGRDGAHQPLSGHDEVQKQQEYSDEYGPGIKPYLCSQQSAAEHALICRHCRLTVVYMGHRQVCDPKDANAAHDTPGHDCLGI